MIVLRTPKGWTGPKVVDGLPAEGTWRSHQVPLSRGARQPGAPRPARALAAQLPPRGAVRRAGALVAELAALAPRGERRMGANPHANGGLLLRDLSAGLPRLRGRGRPAGREPERGDPRPRRVPARRDRAQPRERSASSAPTRPPPTGWARSSRRPNRAWEARDPAHRRPPRPRRARHGGPLRAPLPGLAGGLPADRPARPLQLLRGVHPHRRLDVQPARQVAEGHERHPLAPPHRLAQLPADLARLAPGPQRLLATRTRASSTTSSTRRPRSSASTCRPTRTPCSRSPTTACAAATTST